MLGNVLTIVLLYSTIVFVRFCTDAIKIVRQVFETYTVNMSLNYWSVSRRMTTVVTRSLFWSGLSVLSNQQPSRLTIAIKLTRKIILDQVDSQSLQAGDAIEKKRNSS